MTTNKDAESPQPDRGAPRVAGPSASRTAPRRVAPIVVGGVRYESDWGSIGNFRAVDEKSGKELWALRLYEIAYVPGLETDVQNVFAIEMKKESDTTLLVRDERRRVYRVDLAARASEIAVWPVSLRDAGRPLSVEIVLGNNLKRTVLFDKPSVAVGGELENDLFEVTADGKSVPYGGMMKKRARPDSFLELKPLDEYRQVVDLSKDYAIPKGTETVTVRFRHTNHFSPDGFQLESPPLTIRLADAPPLRAAGAKPKP